MSSAPEVQQIKSIGEFHSLIGLPRPDHPLISVINLEEVKAPGGNIPAKRVLDFYTISLKRGPLSNFQYGQQHYDAECGVMYFLAPGQIFSPPVKAGGSKTDKLSGWGLYIHPDFLWNTPLAKKINKFEYFSYSVHEALWLTEKEEGLIIGLLQNIYSEYHTNMDKFSQDIIISQIETLLNYCDRFYYRQFLTFKVKNYQMLDRLEELLTNYFNSDKVLLHGLPSVQYIAGELNISPNYLSSLLKVLTGRSTQQHIQDKLIDKAKEKISTTDLSLSQISHDLGFEHPQSFSRLFRTKTGLSPLTFRRTFN